MNLICGPASFRALRPKGALSVTLYGQAPKPSWGSAGEAARYDIARQGLVPSPRAWDFLSIALSVITADAAGKRANSPDGWTREFELDIAVIDPDFWNSQIAQLSSALAFLTTDRWLLRFYAGGFLPAPPRRPTMPEEDSIVLLSGGLDSLVGAIDLVAGGHKPFAVSQVVRGDGEKQTDFAADIGGGLRHLQTNHNAKPPGRDEPSQRARSLIFLAFGVLTATTLRRYYEDATIPLFVCENGFIAINPPLTGGRVGSLSTRTAHPEFLGRLQDIFNAAGLRASVKTPYSFKTKGEMLRDCADQKLLKAHAVQSTSCGRYLHYNYTHCGRCVPCQVRRSAFMACRKLEDTTDYVFDPLGKDDGDHAGFDDVRSVAMALRSVEIDGLDKWVGNALSSPMIADRAATRSMIERSLAELKALHKAYGVK